MPITIPKDLPAFDILKSEGVVVMSEYDAKHQDIRPLRIGLLNLMPKKIQTETQFARLIGATPLQIELTLIRMSDHQCKNTPQEHMEAFYKPFEEVKHEKFDGVIVTGAPIEHLDFDDCEYWDELCEVFEWTQTNVHSTFAVCWGGMAMMNYFHSNVRKHDLSAKAFGCFLHDVCVPSSPLLRGFCDELLIPVSRWTHVRQDEIDAASGLVTLLSSDKVGPCLVQDAARNNFYIFNHLEYDAGTLGQEYARDIKSDKDIVLPFNYFPNDDPAKEPRNRWRCHGHLLYGNWINEIYQTTKFKLEDIGK